MTVSLNASRSEVKRPHELSKMRAPVCRTVHMSFGMESFKCLWECGRLGAAGKTVENQQAPSSQGLSASPPRAALTVGLKDKLQLAIGW